MKNDLFLKIFSDLALLGYAMDFPIHAYNNNNNRINV